jgi:riboflavin kinase/FMN adenylyltransferase
LGRNYFIIGKVIYGNNLAQRLGYPTANIKLHQLLRPKYGVYLVRVNIDDKLYFGMANIGVRPTLNNIQELLEVHIFNFSDNIYGKIIKVELLRFIREEKKFDSIDLLVAQINNDDSMIKEMCNDYK